MYHRHIFHLVPDILSLSEGSFGQSFGAEVGHLRSLEQFPSTSPAEPVFFVWTPDRQLISYIVR